MPTYTEAMTRLEAIVRSIESGEMDVDSLTAQLQEAKTLVKLCRQRLTTIDQEVKKILEDDQAPNVKENLKDINTVGQTAFFS